MFLKFNAVKPVVKPNRFSELKVKKKNPCLLLITVVVLYLTKMFSLQHRVDKIKNKCCGCIIDLKKLFDLNSFSVTNLFVHLFYAFSCFPMIKTSDRF